MLRQEAPRERRERLGLSLLSGSIVTGLPVILLAGAGLLWVDQDSPRHPEAKFITPLNAVEINQDSTEVQSLREFLVPALDVSKVVCAKSFTGASGNEYNKQLPVTRNVSYIDDNRPNISEELKSFGANTDILVSGLAIVSCLYPESSIKEIQHMPVVHVG